MTSTAEAFVRLAEGRRSIREFTEQPVLDDQIERVLEAARLAPSAHNRQPWRFVVVRDAMRREALAQAMTERLRQDRAADGDDPSDIQADVERARLRLTHAPVAIIICLTMESMDAYPDARRAQAERIMAVQSVAMAGENLLLAAHAEGLGACWMCSPLFAPEVVRARLGLPEGWEPQGMVLLGHPASSPAARPRSPLREITRWL
jgi:F420 biosynthesis protein FbiB-like protein